jgi:hypothetical protein
MALRIKGQEASIVIVSATSGLEPSITEVKSFTIQFDREILSEGYVGQNTEQKDDIFKGISGSLEIHLQTADILSLLQRINEVSKRRLPGESIQIVATYNFPLGGRRRIVVPDAKFGDIPIENSDRDAFISVSLDFAADDANILAA